MSEGDFYAQEFKSAGEERKQFEAFGHACLKVNVINRLVSFLSSTILEAFQSQQSFKSESTKRLLNKIYERAVIFNFMTNNRTTRPTSSIAVIANTAV